MDDSELGFFSGWITAAYSLGGIPGNFFWGWFADRYGRRWSISLSICGVIISMNIFGLADNFWLAFISRTLWGFLNGNLGIAKTYISEICNDYTQTLGFSIFQTVGGFSSYYFIYNCHIELLVLLLVAFYLNQKRITRV